MRKREAHFLGGDRGKSLEDGRGAFPPRGGGGRRVRGELVRKKKLVGRTRPFAGRCPKTRVMGRGPCGAACATETPCPMAVPCRTFNTPSKPPAQQTLPHNHVPGIALRMALELHRSPWRAFTPPRYDLNSQSSRPVCGPEHPPNPTHHPHLPTCRRHHHHGEATGQDDVVPAAQGGGAADPSKYKSGCKWLCSEGRARGRMEGPMPYAIPPPPPPALIML